MAVALRSFRVNCAPARVWPIVSDFSRWQTLFVVAHARTKGWGKNWRAASGAGVGTKLEMLLDDKVVQEWEVEKWAPPDQLKIASKKWNGKFITAMSSSFDLGMTAVSKEETSIEIQIFSEFTCPVLGLIFNALVPLRKDLASTLARMEQEIRAALAGG